MYDVGHMAINTDDVDETLAFYRSVCGWQFEAWGPPGCYRAQLPGVGTVAFVADPGGNPIGFMQHA